MPLKKDELCKIASSLGIHIDISDTISSIIEKIQKNNRFSTSKGCPVKKEEKEKEKAAKKKEKEKEKAAKKKEKEKEKAAKREKAAKHTSKYQNGNRLNVQYAKFIINESDSHFKIQKPGKGTYTKAYQGYGELRIAPLGDISRDLRGTNFELPPQNEGYVTFECGGGDDEEYRGHCKIKDIVSELKKNRLEAGCTMGRTQSCGI